MIKKNLFECFLILSLSVFTGIFFNFFYPSGISLIGNWDKSKGVISAKAKDDVVNHSREVNDPEVMKDIVDHNKAAICDVRTKEQFDQGHIPGAVSFPLYEFDEVIMNFMEKYKPDEFIVIYCSSLTCSDSHTFAQQVIDMGYSNVKVFSGGFLQWQELGYKIE